MAARRSMAAIRLPRKPRRPRPAPTRPCAPPAMPRRRAAAPSPASRSRIMTTLKFVERLRDLVDHTDVVLSDIWGVVHNGLESFPEACEALHSFRSRGGTVILITNAARPADSVQRQLQKLGVADDTYDAIVSSGDLTRHYVSGHPGAKVFWLGPERDVAIHRGLDLKLSPLDQADYIVCTGLLDDETE